MSKKYVRYDTDDPKLPDWERKYRERLNRDEERREQKDIEFNERYGDNKELALRDAFKFAKDGIENVSKDLAKKIASSAAFGAGISVMGTVPASLIYDATLKDSIVSGVTLAVMFSLPHFINGVMYGGDKWLFQIIERNDHKERDRQEKEGYAQLGQSLKLIGKYFGLTGKQVKEAIIDVFASGKEKQTSTEKKHIDTSRNQSKDI